MTIRVSQPSRKLMLLLAAALTSTPAAAVEIILREVCHPEGSVVRLGDVAAVRAGEDAGQLAEIELFPAPSFGGRRFAGVREIQDILELRGVELSELQFRGARQVAVYGPRPGPRPASQPRRTDGVNSSTRLAAERRVEEALLSHLRNEAGDEPWQVAFEVSDELAGMPTLPDADLEVRGLREPWVGPQQVALIAGPEDKRVRFELDVRVTLPPQVVVAARPLGRGTIIQAGDLRLEPLDAEASLAGLGGRDDAPLYKVEAAVGLEAVRTIPAGRPVSTDAVRRPLLVQRGEIITVYARTGGISVRTTARARDDGSRGDLVQVESTLDRSTYNAYVSGPQEVELFPQPVRAKSGADHGEASGDASWRVSDRDFGPRFKHPLEMRRELR